MSASPIRRALQAVGGLLALAILAWTVRDAVSEFGAMDLDVRIGRALVATGLMIVAFLAAIALWRSLLAAFEARVGFGAAVQLWSFSNLGRYLPGKVWHVVGAMVVASDVGVRASAAASVALLAVTLQIGTGAIVALPLLLGLPDRFALATVVAGAVALTPLVPLAAPGIVPALLRRLPKSLGGIELPPPARGQVLGWILALVGIWILQGGAFALLGSAFTDVALADVPRWVGAWATAYVIGLLALFAPGGLGVREGVLAVLLEQLGLTDEAGSVIAVASRLWSIAAEVLVLGLALALRARSRRS